MQISKYEQIYHDNNVKWLEDNRNTDTEVFVTMRQADDLKVASKGQRSLVILASIIIISSTAVFAARAKRKKE